MYVTLYPNCFGDTVERVAALAAAAIAEVAGLKLGEGGEIDCELDLIDGDRDCVVALVALVDMLYDVPVSGSGSVLWSCPAAVDT